jgi:hypothetical protein
MTQPNRGRINPPRRFRGYNRVAIDEEKSEITLTYRWHEDELEPLDSQWLSSDFADDFDDLAELPGFGVFRYTIEDASNTEYADGWRESDFALSVERVRD